MEEGRRSLKILKGKPRGKIPLGTPRRRWEDNIRRDLSKSSAYVVVYRPTVLR
jgi:hypothetical protein